MKLHGDQPQQPGDQPEPVDPGLECPSCGCRDLRVYYTRQRPSHIMRVRLCRHCGRRIVTRETLANDRRDAA